MFDPFQLLNPVVIKLKILISRCFLRNICVEWYIYRNLLFVCFSCYSKWFAWGRKGFIWKSLLHLDYWRAYSFCSPSSLFLRCLVLHKICKNTGFHWPVSPCIRTESKFCPYTWGYRSVKTLYSRLFHALSERVYECCVYLMFLLKNNHCVKTVQTRSYLWSVFGHI